jgi:hypothetical protein
VKRMLKSRNVSSASLESNQLEKRNSRKSFFLTKNLSITRETLSRFFFAKRFTNWLANLKRTNYFRRSVSIKRLKRRKSYRTDLWSMPSRPTTRIRSNF